MRWAVVHTEEENRVTHHRTKRAALRELRRHRGRAYLCRLYSWTYLKRRLRLNRREIRAACRAAVELGRS